MIHLKEFQVFEYKEEYSDEHVSDHIRDITPESSDIPDHFIDNVIKGRKFVRRDIKIEDILASDKTVKDYVNSGEERYQDEEVDDDDLFLPIVVVDGKVMDGYSRISALYKAGEKEITAYDAI